MHNGKTVAEKGRWKVIDCDICKIKHLSPLPSDNKLKTFYAKSYFKLVKKGRRANEMQRLMRNTRASKSERNWLRKTLYKDISHILEKHTGRTKTLVDIGCGTGEFLRYMKKEGWRGIGIEPSKDAKGMKKKYGITVYNTPFKEFFEAYPDHHNKFDAAVLLNVLEHVLDPKAFLVKVKGLLKSNKGIICVRVPNDFSPLQKHARGVIKKSPWWIATLDHINYFDRKSLIKLLKSAGFNIVHVTADFPMELFLLMGHDYISSPCVGRNCHNRRMNFEMALPAELRRSIYRQLAQLDIGRDLCVFAKVRRK